MRVEDAARERVGDLDVFELADERFAIPVESGEVIFGEPVGQWFSARRFDRVRQKPARANHQQQSGAEALNSCSWGISGDS